MTLFMHFSLALRITSSSNNEKRRRQLLEHQGTANPPLLSQKKKTSLHALSSYVETYVKPTPSLSSGFCHLNHFSHTVFMPTKSKTSWKIAMAKCAQSSTVYEVNSILRCRCLSLHTRNNKRKYQFSQISFQLKAAQVNVHTYH